MGKNELTISEVRAMYFDDDALILSPFKLYRYHFKSYRYYYYQMPMEPAMENQMPTDAEGILFPPEPKPNPVRLAVGVTTLTRRTMPTDDQLIKWIASMGYDAAIAYRDQRSKYGSLFHTIAAELLIKRKFDLDSLDEIVAGYAAKNGIVINIDEWIDEYKSDILALTQWIIEYNVKPLAIELSLVSPRLNVAGTLDLFCEMDFPETGFFGETYKSGERKGQPKETKRINRTLAIVDFKTGKNTGFGLANAAQLQLLKILLDETMQTVYGTDIHASKIALYNWHPREWRTKPSYSLIDQTMAMTAADALNLVNVYPMYDPDPTERTELKMSGMVDIDAGIAGIEKNVMVEKITDIMQNRIDAGDVPLMQYDVTGNYLDEPDANE
jgi:hypothetical protein